MSTPLREQVYRSLRDDILNGRVSSRDRLTEPKLSRRYEVSRTPVREALSRLLSEGLIERTDFGYAITVPSPDELQNLHELRITLELHGITRCLDTPDRVHDKALLDDELEHWQARQRQPPDPGPAFGLEDDRFHRVLSQAAGNPQLTEALVTVLEKIRPSGPEPLHLPRSIAEHIEILELLRQQDLPAARQVLHRHLARTA
ncbi:GntR family transcriptional regulator [Kineosporia babensis]|uniref:GntR family transcriptional regulator n=1 Tax=Kineosporia babensis TaxID=499548 RepID=A0A9X1NEN5_9ACTN|nr:GntR family transcriptional regulator [Kineosporia babensis]